MNHQSLRVYGHPDEDELLLDPTSKEPKFWVLEKPPSI